MKKTDAEKIRYLLKKVEMGQDTRESLIEISYLWKKDKNNIIETVVEASWGASNRVNQTGGAIHLASLWAMIVGPQIKEGDIAHQMKLFLGSGEFDKEALAIFAKADSVSWATRDDFMLISYPFVMDWMEENRSREFIRKTLDDITDQIMRLACRREEHAVDILSRMAKYYTPDEIVRSDGGLGRGTWAQVWANHCFHAMEDRMCGALALNWLVSWGVDVDQKNDKGQSALSKELDMGHKKAHAAESIHAIECLTLAGANWKDAFDEGTHIQRELLMKTTAVKRDLLLRVIKENKSSGKEKIKQAGPTRNKMKL